MKKGILFVGALVALTFASCKKDWTCECCTSSGSSSICGSATTKAKKKDAQESCDKGDATYTSGGATYTTACSIK